MSQPILQKDIARRIGFLSEIYVDLHIKIN